MFASWFVVVAVQAHRLVVLLAIWLLAGALFVPQARADAQPGVRLRRYALVASSNDGGAGRTPLRFANSDAHAVSDVLMQLGGLQKQDLILLPDASRTRVRAGFDELRQMLEHPAAPGTRRELFVYYSGHSDEEGLLLGNERIPYRELRQWIQSLGAEVRIAVLDSCASGALIRLKGGAMRPPFLDDASTDARGHAYLTASTADEAAQESDRVGAAFFTHYLVSGLRGAADSNRDGRVTLNEAYQFAYHETLRRTQKSRAGAQHPTYDIQLAGTGDLVMTDLRSTDARLVLGEALVGHIFVRDAAGRLLVELHKEPGYPVELGLGPGQYRVLMNRDGQPFETTVKLERHARRALEQSDFRGTQAIVTGTRGSASGPLRHVPFDLVAAPGVRISGRPDQPVLHNFVLGLLGHSDALDGIQLSLGGNIVDGSMSGIQIAPGLNLVRGPGAGAQLSSGVNLALGGFRGVQVGPLVNWSKGGLHGLQAGLINHNGGRLQGAQMGVINLNRGDWFQGAQMGVINLNRGDFCGAQYGVANLSGGIQGMQIAVVNVGGAVSGSQIGVLNIAGKVSGLQLGVLNIADSVDGASLGVLPLVRDGYHRGAVWTSDVSLSNFGFKLGSRHVYTLLGAGLSRDPDDDRALFSTHMGLGGHVVLGGGRFFIDIDVLATQMGNMWRDYANRASVLGALRFVLGYQMADHLAVTLGPTYNVQTSWNGEDYETGLGVFEKVIRSGRTTVRMFPGFVLGVQI